METEWTRKSWVGLWSEKRKVGIAITNFVEVRRLRHCARRVSDENRVQPPATGVSRGRGRVRDRLQELARRRWEWSWRALVGAAAVAGRGMAEAATETLFVPTLPSFPPIARSRRCRRSQTSTARAILEGRTRPSRLRICPWSQLRTKGL